MDKEQKQTRMILEQEVIISELQVKLMQLANDNYNLQQHNKDQSMQISRLNNQIIALRNENEDNQQLIDNSQNHNLSHIELTQKLIFDNQRLNSQINNLVQALQLSLQQIKDLEQNLKLQFQKQDKELNTKNADYIQLQICNMELQKKNNKLKYECSNLRQQQQILEEKFKSYKKQQVIQNFKYCFSQIVRMQNNNEDSMFDINVERLEEDFLENLKSFISFKEVD